MNKDELLPPAPSASDEATTPESAIPIESLALPDELVGQVDDDIGDLFAPENLRISQDFVEEAGTEPILGAIAVRKPLKHEFFQVQPTWHMDVAVIESEDRELWIVVKELAEKVRDEVSVVQLRLAVNRFGLPFLWPLKISRSSKSNPWNLSAMAAADRAKTRWVCIRSNQSTGQYDIRVAKADFGEPKWPDLPERKIMELAFKGRVIAGYDHSLLKQLRGEA